MILTFVAEPLYGQDYSLARNAVLKDWFAYKDAQTFGDDEQARSALRDLIATQARLDLSDLPVVSKGLIREANKFAAKGKFKQAAKLADYAVLFSPSMPEPLFSYAKLHLSLRNFKPQIGIPKLVDSIKLAVANQTIRIRHLTNFLLYLSAVLALFTSLFCLTIFCKYARLLSYDLTNLLPTGTPSFLSMTLFAILICFAHIFLGWTGTFASLILSIWIYATRKEKALIGVIIVIMMTPLFVFPTLSAKLRLAAGIGTAITTARQGVDLSHKAQFLHNWVQKNSSDVSAISALAAVEVSAGNFLLARTLLQRAVELRPRWYKAHLSLANVLYRLGEHDESVEHYKKAIQLKPRSFRARYNFGKLYHHLAQLEAGNKELQQARVLSPHSFEILEEISKPNIAIPTSESITWEEIIAETKKGPRFIRGTKELYLAAGPLMRWNPYGSVILLVALLILSRIRKRIVPSFSCEKCGMVVSREVESSLAHSIFCQQCHNLFIKRVTIDPQIRLSKEQQIQKYIKRLNWVRRMSALVLPGSGNIALEKTISGAGLLLLFSVAIVIISKSVTPVYSSIYVEPSLFISTLLPIGLILGVCSVSLISVLRK